MACILNSACSPAPDGGGQEADAELVIGIPEANANDVGVGVSQFVNIFLIFESLTSNGPDGRAVPRLAERWRWDDDGLTLRVDLRPGVTLHDGRAFTAAVAADLVRAAIARGGNRASYPALSDVASVSAAGPLELVFDLTRPSALLPEDLTVALEGPQGTGTGPFRVVSTAPELVLERFDRYYLGSPSVRRIVVRSFDTLRTSWASLLRGEVDMVYDVPADAVEFIRNDDVDVIAFARWYQFLIAFNSSAPALQSPAVRRALNLAINREELISNVLRGRGAPSTGPLWPKYWAYGNDVARYVHDPEQAKALLDAAGLRMPTQSDIPGRPPARLRLTCLLPENFTVWERIALEVQKDLFDIGVDMQFEVMPFDEFNGRVGSGNFEAAFLDMISGPTPGRAYTFWRSARSFKGRYNVFGYENAEAERLFHVLRETTNEAAVRSATGRLQRVLLDDPPALFIAWSERARAVRREFAVPADPDRDPILSVSQWTARPSELSAAE